MTERLTFNSEDIRTLAAKLDAVTASFDEGERILLGAVIGLAKETLDGRAGGEVEGFAGPSIGEIVVTKHTDTASPGLSLSGLAGPPASKGGNKAPVTYLQVTLTEAFIS
ncbi:MAG TPA: hypothetical protein VE197_00010 [Mycobacterium sp.]|nr:hypothetical protein [Mycobacterium sp.]